ncbi:hypothetical protein FOZ62_031591, partial [Perkinsus olseni]
HNPDPHDDAAGRHRDVSAQRNRAGSDRRFTGCTPRYRFGKLLAFYGPSRPWRYLHIDDIAAAFNLQAAVVLDGAAQRRKQDATRCEDLFPAARAGQSKVFVVDFGGGRTPKDDCCNMLRRVVSFNINYAYLPEDNPVVALHWANKVWIPAVSKRQSLENKDEPKRALYRYALVVNDFDGVDERALPEVFNSHCREHVEKGTQLVILPPRAMMPSGSIKTSWMVDDFLVQRENM